jgi:hypothetical protein
MHVEKDTNEGATAKELIPRVGKCLGVGFQYEWSKCWIYVRGDTYADIQMT